VHVFTQPGPKADIDQSRATLDSASEGTAVASHVLLSAWRYFAVERGIGHETTCFITGFCASMAWPLVSHAQQPDPIRLIGVLTGYAESDPAAQSEIAAFRSRLMELGWMEGRNLRIELRWGGGDGLRLKLSQEVGRAATRRDPQSKYGCNGCPSARDADDSIVFVIVADPVAKRFRD